VCSALRGFLSSGLWLFCFLFRPTTVAIFALFCSPFFWPLWSFTTLPLNLPLFPESTSTVFWTGRGYLGTDVEGVLRFSLDGVFCLRPFFDDVFFFFGTPLAGGVPRGGFKPAVLPALFFLLFAGLVFFCPLASPYQILNRFEIRRHPIGLSVFFA